MCTPRLRVSASELRNSAYHSFTSGASDSEDLPALPVFAAISTYDVNSCPQLRRRLRQHQLTVPPAAILNRVVPMARTARPESSVCTARSSLRVSASEVRNNVYHSFTSERL